MTLKLLKSVYFKIALLALAALSAAGILASWAAAFSLSRQTRAAVAIAEEESRPALVAKPAQEGADAEAKPTETKKGAARAARKAAREAAQMPAELEELVKSKGLFGKASTVVILQGILGKKALINGEWIAVGEERNGVKLVEFDEKRAVVEVAGETKEVPIWTPLGGFVPKKGQKWGTGGLRDGRDRGSASSSEREEMRKRYQSMSESERQAFRDKMRQQYGGSGGGRGGGNGMDRGQRGQGRDDSRRNANSQERSEKKKIR